MDWVPFPCSAMMGPEPHTGASLVPLPLGPGDSARADRGDASATPIIEPVRQQAAVILRRSPAHLPVYGRAGQRRDLGQVLRAQPWATQRTMVVSVQAPARTETVPGSIQAYRRSAE